MSSFTRVGLVGRFGGTKGSSNPALWQTMAEIVNSLYVVNKLDYLYVDEDTFESFREEFTELTRNHHRHFVTSATKKIMNENCEALIVVGGDGTMLHVAHTTPKPILLGVNLGRVGFITDIPAQDACWMVSELIANSEEGKLREYGLLEANAIAGQGKHKIFSMNRVMNEFHISRATSKLLELNVYIDDAFAFHVRADGLLISTPVGSTAYSLAAGGSIMSPKCDTLQIVPMMPQTLSHRPLIVSGESEIALEVKSGIAMIEGDGQDNGLNTLYEGAFINIRYSAEKIRMLKPSSYSYYETLRTKLNWHLEAGTKPIDN
jgi:NAD+ kinase